jgi:hypothetical protein
MGELRDIPLGGGGGDFLLEISQASPARLSNKSGMKVKT